MAINACSINAYTINSIACRRRALVYPVATPVVGTNNQSLRDSFALQRPDLLRHFDDEDIKPLEFEQPLITVRVTLDGVTMQHTLDNVGRLDLVTVTDLTVVPIRVAEAQDVTVNISDISIILKS